MFLPEPSKSAKSSLTRWPSRTGSPRLFLKAAATAAARGSGHVHAVQNVGERLSSLHDDKLLFHLRRLRRVARRDGDVFRHHAHFDCRRRA